MIITVMAGDSPDRTNLSPHLAELWERWQLGTGIAVSAGRRAEDQAAAMALGAQLEFWPWLDAVYRLDAANDLFIYAARDAIFGDISAADPLVAAVENAANNPLTCAFLQRLQDGDTVHSPLSVGGHVDHRLVHYLTRTMLSARKNDRLKVFYYEEYPYSAPDYKGTNTGQVVKKALEQATLWFNTNGTVKLQPVAIIHPLDSIALDAKIAAIDCYHSQISSFWPDSPAMADSVHRYTQQVGGEREWYFIRDDGSPAPSTSP